MSPFCRRAVYFTRCAMRPTLKEMTYFVFKKGGVDPPIFSKNDTHGSTQGILNIRGSLVLRICLRSTQGIPNIKGSLVLRIRLRRTQGLTWTPGLARVAFLFPTD